MKQSFTIAWPHKDLSPNARVNRFEKAALVKEYRLDTAWLLESFGVAPMHAERVHVSLEFCPPDNRRRDLDNMLASIKAALDAVADCIGVDDSNWEISLCRGAPVRHGEINVTVEALAVIGAKEA